MQSEHPEQTEFFKNLFKAPPTGESILVDTLLDIIENTRNLSPAELAEKLCIAFAKNIVKSRNTYFEQLTYKVGRFEIGIDKQLTPEIFIAEMKQILLDYKASLPLPKELMVTTIRPK